MISLAIKTGYTKKEMGYSKDTNTVRHCIVFLAEGSLLMWGYKQVGATLFNGEPQSLYNTGILKMITEPDLRVLMSTFLKEHN